MWLLVAAGLLTVEVHDSRRVGDRVRLGLGATLVSVDGRIMDTGGEWTVLAGTTPLELVARKSWSAAGGELVIAVVLERAADLTPLHLVAAEPLAALQMLAARSTTSGVNDDELLAGIDAAVTEVAAARPAGDGPLRRVVIVIGKGLDADPRAERYTELGRRADAAGVRIHTLAWHPRGDRRSMLGLAELSARSHGTFRMLTGHGDALAASVAAHVEQLRLELVDQPQLIVEAPAAALGSPLSARYGTIESRNQVSFTPPATAGGRKLRWWWIAGPAVLLAGGAAAVVLVRRRGKAAA